LTQLTQEVTTYLLPHHNKKRSAKADLQFDFIFYWLITL